MKNKKNKKKNKKLEDIPKKEDKINNNDDISDDLTDSSNNNFEKNLHSNRKHTKIIKKNKSEKIKKEEDKNERKKVRFGKIDIIDVECWKEINLELTADETVDEIMKLAEGKGNNRTKNIGCTCLII